jgi:copper chaperone CopZ
MTSHQVEFNVDMHCDGCARAVTGALKKVKGVTDVKCDVQQKKVTVTGTASTEDMLNAIKKTGKTVSVASK